MTGEELSAKEVRAEELRAALGRLNLLRDRDRPEYRVVTEALLRHRETGEFELPRSGEQWRWLGSYVVTAVDRLVERYGDEHGAAPGYGDDDLLNDLLLWLVVKLEGSADERDELTALRCRLWLRYRQVDVRRQREAAELVGAPWPPDATWFSALLPESLALHGEPENDEQQRELAGLLRVSLQAAAEGSPRPWRWPWEPQQVHHGVLRRTAEGRPQPETRSIALEEARQRAGALREHRVEALPVVYPSDGSGDVKDLYGRAGDRPEGEALLVAASELVMPPASSEAPAPGPRRGGRPALHLVDPPGEDEEPAPDIAEETPATPGIPVRNDELALRRYLSTP